MTHPDFNSRKFDGGSVFSSPQTGEIRANIMLSFRHLEDARMRLGKAIQYIDGGVSILDKLEYSEKEPVQEKPTAGEQL